MILKGATETNHNKFPFNQEIVIGLLEESGIDIDVASNGKMAIEKLKYSRYELIFMDLQMPVMDGYEASIYIRETDSSTPIIALSANVLEEDVAKSKEAGMNEHLNKPVEVEKLYQVLLKYILKKVDIPVDLSLYKIEITQAEKIKIPSFDSLDSVLGLLHFNDDRKLYMKIVNTFYDDYVHFTFDGLSDEAFKRAIHTLKGLSKGIGATALYAIAKTLDETQDKALCPKLIVELKIVTDEIANMQEMKTLGDSPEITGEMRNRLFADLKEAIVKKRTRLSLPIIEALQGYTLSEKDSQTIDIVNELLKNREFKKGLEMLD